VPVWGTRVGLIALLKHRPLPLLLLLLLLLLLPPPHLLLLHRWRRF
jgi:hypothetical protein